MEKVTPEIMAQLEADNGPVIHLQVDEFGEAVFRVAKLHEHRRFMDEISDPEKKSRALDPLVASCRVWPSKEEFDAMVAARPGLIQSFGAELIKFNGVKQAVAVKK